MANLPELYEPGEPGLLRTRWKDFVMANTETFYAFMLLAATHYATLHPSPENGPILIEMKARAEVATRVVSEFDLTDGVIAAAAIMAGYEILFPEEKTRKIHMRGLATMVAKRGGVSNLGLDGFLAKICLLVDSFAHIIHKMARSFPPSAYAQVPMRISARSFAAVWRLFGEEDDLLFQQNTPEGWIVKVFSSSFKHKWYAQNDWRRDNLKASGGWASVGNWETVAL
jgi:hypothetical protein